MQQVAHLNVPGSDLYRKLRQLKSEKGGLTSQDERHFAQIRRSLEAEVLAHADVVSSPRGGWLVMFRSHQAVRVRRVGRRCCWPTLVLVFSLDLVLNGWHLVTCILCPCLHLKTPNCYAALHAQVCATCVGAGDARVSALRFQHVLVDECTQASEPEALIPLVLGAKQVRG